MDTFKFFKRLSKAHSKNSLREISAWCGVSHELIRKALESKGNVNLTISSYEKIDKGLRENGF